MPPPSRCAATTTFRSSCSTFARTATSAACYRASRSARWCTERRGEEGRVAVRNVRRHHKDEVEKLEREHAISEDELRRAERELQKLTDQYVAEVDQVLGTKEKELSEV